MTRGPAPKRSDQRRRRNQPDTPIRKGQAQPFVEQPEPGKDWHPKALDWYRALALSGQSVFYEPSDWEMAAVGAALYTELLTDGFTASGTATFLTINQDLMATEASRRRARVELERDPANLPAQPKPSSSRDRDRALLEAV